jgi:hypothetical protein
MRLHRLEPKRQADALASLPRGQLPKDEDGHRGLHGRSIMSAFRLQEPPVDEPFDLRFV